MNCLSLDPSTRYSEETKADRSWLRCKVAGQTIGGQLSFVQYICREGSESITPFVKREPCVTERSADLEDDEYQAFVLTYC